MISGDWQPRERQHVLAVHESGRRWADILRGGVLGSQIQVRHSVGVRDTLAVVRAESRCTLVLELGRQPLQSLALLEQVAAMGNDYVVIVVARSDQGDFELPARELGATAFIREPLSGAEVASIVRSIVRRQLRRAIATGS
jgi:DNA-binding response OmpR family regulator